MPDLVKLNENKNKILSVIQKTGPSFPNRIARETGINPLFVSAMLSELVSDKKVKMSSMKVGSSPLYFIQGQEQNLEDFVSYLNPTEREAYELLKKHEVLDDSVQDPAIRVALRKLRDFAHPINVRVDQEQKSFWKFFLLSDENVRDKITAIINPPKPKESKKFPEKKTEVKEKSEEQIVKKIEKTETKKAKETPSQMSTQIKDYLTAKDIEILEELPAKKKEFMAKVRIDTLLGKQEYCLILKDKKKVNESDLITALQKAQLEKMPALVLSPGDLDKNAQTYLKDWKNLIKFEKLNI